MTRRRVAHIAAWTVAVVTAVAVLLAAHGGMLDPREWGFVPGVMVILFTHVGVGAVVVAILLAIFRLWKPLALVAVALFTCLPRVVRSYPHNHDEPCKCEQFTVMTWNVAAFPRVAPGDTSDVMRTILDLNPTFVLMQEMMQADSGFHYDQVPAIKCYIDELDKKYPYRSYPYRDDVAILSKYPFTIDTIVPQQRGYDALSRYQDVDHYATLAFDVVVFDKKIRLVSTHLRSFGLSNADKRLAGAHVQGEHDVEQGSAVYGMSLPAKLSRAFALRAQEAAQLRQAIDAGPETVIVCGDFNDVMDSWAYRTIHSSDMRDAWLDGGSGNVPTYAKAPLRCKIDHMLYRGNITAVHSVIHDNLPLTPTGSDHYPMVTTFVMGNDH